MSTIIQMLSTAVETALKKVLAMEQEKRRIPFALPDIRDEDRAAVHAVLSQPILADGPQVRAFEGEFAAYLGGHYHAIATSSCYAALHLSWLALGIGPGDEVICPALTHVATAHAITMTGATPVFVDCDPQTGCITAALIEPHLTNKTRAICVMHYAGIPCDMPDILLLAGRRALFVVEDCATALGARSDRQSVGLDGHCSAFSFYPAKHITTGEGGMLVTTEKWIADKARQMRAFGITTGRSYDVPLLGVNYRMSEIAAALGRGQLRRFPAALEKRRKNWAMLSERLKQISGIRVVQLDDEDNEHAAYCLIARVSNRDDVRHSLGEAGIESSLYYPRVMTDLSFYFQPDQPHPTSYATTAGADCTVGQHRDVTRGLWWSARALVNSSLALPCYQQLTESDMVWMGKHVGQSVKGWGDKGDGVRNV